MFHWVKIKSPALFHLIVTALSDSLKINMEDQFEENYELTLFIKNEDISSVKKNLEAKGVKILKEKEIQKTRLAYPIKKQAYGYLCILSIGLPKDGVSKMMNDLNLEEGILRYALTKFNKHKAGEREEESRSKPARSGERRIFRTPKKPTEPALTNEALERKIEEILK